MKRKRKYRPQPHALQWYTEFRDTLKTEIPMEADNETGPQTPKNVVSFV